MIRVEMEKVQRDYLKIVLIVLGVLALLEFMTMNGILQLDFKLWVPLALLFLGLVAAWIYGKTSFPFYFFIGIALIVGGFLVFVDFWTGFDQKYVGAIVYIAIFFMILWRLFNKSIETEDAEKKESGE